MTNEINFCLKSHPGFNYLVNTPLIIILISEVNRLLWVRGKNPVRCTQVACSWDSLNKSDCFILDVGNDIYSKYRIQTSFLNS